MPRKSRIDAPGALHHIIAHRYKSILCQQDAYLLELVRYIHLNPLRARLVPTICHPWTSIHLAGRMKRRYALQAKGVSLEQVAERVAELFNIPSSELWLPGKHRQRVGAKSLLCYWANRQLGISMAKLSRRMNVSVMAVSYSVQRGEKIAEELNYSL